MNAYPFPGRELAMDELRRDVCFLKIPPSDYEKVIDIAWDSGTNAAKEMSFDFLSKSIGQIAEDSGLRVVRKNSDNVIGGTRYFCDYLTGQSEIILYLKAVQLWADQNKLEMQLAENLILAHEYYHFLEYSRIGFTSRKYSVPAIKIGNLSLGKTGIRAMSEIGAHAFAFVYYNAVKGEH